MQAIGSSNQTLWKQVYQDALLEFDPVHHRTKLEAAKRAIEERVFEVRSHGGSDRRELTDLEDARRIIVLLEGWEQRAEDEKASTMRR
ncbi:MAG TPA: hypothetical protein VEI52_06700 [Terriglobales bacterium]|nr:hypothetical protein [Terriglobales bacterium]